MTKLINISELANLLNLVNSKTKKPSNYILRYWEKEFKQIRPVILKNRRYYSEKQINIIKLIKFFNIIIKSSVILLVYEVGRPVFKFIFLDISFFVKLILLISDI